MVKATLKIPSYASEPRKTSRFPPNPDAKANVVAPAASAHLQTGQKKVPGSKYKTKRPEEPGEVGNTEGDSVRVPPLVRKNSAAVHALAKRRRVKGDAGVSGREALRADGNAIAAGR